MRYKINTILRQIFKQLSKAFTISLFSLVVFMLGSMLMPAQQLHATGNTYYVAKDGNNTNPGTMNQPWLTINWAVDHVNAGDTIYVRDGTYKEHIILGVSGTTGNWIYLKNYPGESPIIDGTDLGLAEYMGLVHIEASYIHLEGFEVRNNQTGHGIRARRNTTITSHLFFKDLVIHDCAKTGIEITSTSPTIPIKDVTIDNLEIYKCNYAGGGSGTNISLNSVHDFEVKNCHIHDNDQEGIAARLGCSNGLIHDNEVEGSPSVGIYLNNHSVAQDNISIYNNIIHNNHTGIALADEIGSTALTNIDIYNNLIYENTGGFSAWPAHVFYKTFNLVNNTFYNNSSHQASVGNTADYNKNCVVRNNIFICKDNNVGLFWYSDYANGGVTVDHNLFYSVNNKYNKYNKYGTNYIRKNPLLVNPTVDFSLSVGSPAIDAGSADSAPSSDYAGTSRPEGARFDIGAYEYRVLTPVPPITANAAFGLTATGAILLARYLSKILVGLSLDNGDSPKLVEILSIFKLSYRISTNAVNNHD